jgi:hypothetical protein
MNSLRIVSDTSAFPAMNDQTRSSKEKIDPARTQKRTTRMAIRIGPDSVNSGNSGIRKSVEMGSMSKSISSAYMKTLLINHTNRDQDKRVDFTLPQNNLAPKQFDSGT